MSIHGRAIDLLYNKLADLDPEIVEQVVERLTKENHTFDHYGPLVGWCLAEISRHIESLELEIKELEQKIELMNQLDQTPATVCLSHLRFVPCRSCNLDEDDLWWSTNPKDIAAVASYQKNPRCVVCEGLITEDENIERSRHAVGFAHVLCESQNV